MTSLHIATPNVDRVGMFPNPTMGVAQPARRKRERFPITVQAEYVLAGSRAKAKTRDISSGGVFLSTDMILKVGESIQVLIDWPVLLEERCHLRLVIFGKVLRSDWAGTAVGITRYEFRIRAQNAAQFMRPIHSADEN